MAVERKRARILVLSVLVCHVLLLAWSSRQHSPTFNELGHVPAGLSHWQYQMFHLYKVNPPLPRLVATFPLLFVDLETDWSNYNSSPFSREVILMGVRFAKANGERVFWLYTLARWACIPFCLLGGVICYRWAAELWGRPSGLVALVTWCFSPTILGHGSVVMPDVPAAATGLTACYFFWHWLKKPDWTATLIIGCALGIANLCKTSLIVFYGIWPMLWLIRSVADRSLAVRKRALQASMLAAAMASSLLVINLGYGFAGSFQPLGGFHFLSTSLGGKPTQNGQPVPGNRFIGTWLENVPVPVPDNYLQGIDRQRADFEMTDHSYLRGVWKKDGYWDYYLYALAIKMPLGTLSLLAATVLGSFVFRWFPNRWKDELCLLVPAIVIVVLVSTQLGFTTHSRYVIPALPFVFVWASKAALVFSRRGVWASRCVLFALSWTVASSLWVFPHSLSYFNETVGGPTRGHEHLVGSNIAWGQDLLYLKRWRQQHPEAEPFHLVHFGWIEPTLAGIDFKTPPFGPDQPGRRFESVDPRQLGPQPGWFVIDVNYLQGSHWRFATGDGRRQEFLTEGLNYKYFKQFQPVSRVAYSMCVYHISLDEANRERQRLGLPEL